jgi:hypothetical protein
MARGKDSTYPTASLPSACSASKLEIEIVPQWNQ